jgi:hypothetical protein
MGVDRLISQVADARMRAPAETYLHLKADLPRVQAVAGTSTRPQVGKALHGEGRGAVAVPGHLEVQVAVVW